jgi:hypothetical protein
MDTAEIRFIRYLLKREAQRFLKKSAHPPSCENLLKVPRHLVQLLVIRILNPKTIIDSSARMDRKNVVFAMVFQRRGTSLCPLLQKKQIL